MQNHETLEQGITIFRPTKTKYTFQFHDHRHKTGSTWVVNMIAARGNNTYHSLNLNDVYIYCCRTW